MMTQLEATNRSLALLGVAPVATVSDDTQAGRTTLRQFELTRSSVLSEFPWAFAIRFTLLNASNAAPISGWNYSFNYPTGATALWDIYRGRSDRFNFRLADLRRATFTVQNRIIYTRENDVVAEYSVDMPFTSFDDAAQEAVVHRLAADCAVTLTGSEQIAQAMLEKYMLFGTIAKRNTRNQRNDGRVISGSYRNVRRPGGGEIL